MNGEHNAVLNALKRACYSEFGLLKATDIPLTTLRVVLKDLIRRGKVEKDGHRFQLKERR